MSRTKMTAGVGLWIVFQMTHLAFTEEVSFTDMLSRIPGNANALVMINADKIRNSPFARREVQPSVNRHMVLPSEVDRVVLAAKLDTGSLTPVWEVAVVSTTNEPSLSKIARTRGGKPESLGQTRSVWLPTNSYLVTLGPRLLGIQFPADRQHAAKWAEGARNRQGMTLSKYLQGASKYPEAVGTEIILALDLQYVVGASAVRENLNNSKVLAGKQVDLDRLSELLASIQGVTLGIRVVDRVVGKLRIDFGQDAGIMADFAKPLILEKLADLGATIDDFETWTGDVKGNTVYLGGTLSVDGLRRVLSVVDPPPTPVEESEPRQQVRSPSDLDRKANPSQHHFNSVQTLLDDVRKSSKTGSFSTGQFGLWYDRYAKKIDQLPILDVDGDLLDYGADMANTLRGLSGEYRGVGTQAARYSNNSPGGLRYGYTYGRYGYGNRYAVTRATGPSASSVAKRVGRANAAQTRSTEFQLMDEETAKMRRLMTERYGIEF